MAANAEVAFEGWLFKTKGSFLASLFKGTKKRYCLLKRDEKPVLECYDKEGGTLVTSVKIVEADHPIDDKWLHIKGYNEVKSRDVYLRIKGDPEVPGETEEWLENIQGILARRSDADIHAAAKAWLENWEEAETRYGPIKEWDVSQVTNMKELFRVTKDNEDAAENFNGVKADLSKWDTSNVTNMFRMFQNCRAFDGDLSKWQTGNVTNMGQMFHGAHSFNSDLGNWNTGNVTNMSMMFFGARAFKRNLGKWDTSKVTDMESMFERTPALKEKPSWYKS